MRNHEYRRVERGILRPANFTLIEHAPGDSIQLEILPEALGPGLDVLGRIKTALDPHGILNPGKLAMASPFGEVAWPY